MQKYNQLRRMQTAATLSANNTQHSWAQHVASVCMEPQQCWHLLAHVAYSLKPVRLLAQQVPAFILFCDSAKRSATMLRPFAWDHNNVGLVQTSAHAPCNLFFKKEKKQSLRVFFFLHCCKHGVSS